MNMSLQRLFVFALIFFSVFFVAASLPALAQVQAPMSATELRKLCVSRYDIDAGICAGYAAAVADRLMHDSNPGRAVCLSPAISPQTLVENLIRAWTEAPPAPQEGAYEAVEGAFRRRFRCP